MAKHALAKPAWGHRKIWAMTRHDGHKVSQATVLRLLRDDGLILPSGSPEAAPRAGEGPEGGVREEPDRPEPGLAAGIFEQHQVFLVCSQMVARCTPSRLAMDMTLSPFARAVRIASTCLSVSGVLARPLGFAMTPSSSSVAPSGS